MEAQVDAWRRGEYYGETRNTIPDDSVVIGQDLVNRQMLADEPAGATRDGYTDATALALVDHREFSSNSDLFTKQIRKLAGPGLNRSRAVDSALRRSEESRRKGVESNLIIYATATWQIRTGEVACTCITDAITNIIRILQRLDFARQLTLEGVRVEPCKVLICEYYAFLERYYVRQYAQPIREQLFNRFGQLATVWETSKSLWHAIPAPMQGTGVYVNIAQEVTIRCRYTSAERRSRSRSPR